MVNIPTDFREFIKLLNKNKVRYLIVGGYAVAVHGYPRFTGDIDILIDRTPDNASEVLKTLDDFGFSSIGILIEDLTTEDQVIQLGQPPLRIDLLTSIDGVTFKEVWGNRINREVDGLTVNLISFDDLIKNKKAANRRKDNADIEGLGKL